MVQVSNPAEKKALNATECAAIVQQAARFVTTHRNMFQVASEYNAFRPAYMHEKGRVSSSLDEVEKDIAAVVSSRTGRDFKIAFNNLAQSLTTALEARAGKGEGIIELTNEHRTSLNGGRLGADNPASQNLFEATRATSDSSAKLSQFCKNRRNVTAPELSPNELNQFRQQATSYPSVKEMATKVQSNSRN